MAETVGFHVMPSLGGLFVGLALPLWFVLFGIFVPLVVLLPPVLTATSSRVRVNVRAASTSFLAFAVCLLAGNVVSEACLLVDEARFSAEVANGSRTAIYSRPRAWPNDLGGLVYVPGNGIHSTD
jgi:hypothetical protein